MAILIAFYSRAGENYFGGAYRRISVGNTEKAAEMLAGLTGGSFPFSAFLSGALFTAVPGIVAQLVLIPLLLTALQKAGFAD